MRAGLELHIEELLLEGFAPENRLRIAAAVEMELARLFGERGVPPPLDRAGEIARVGAGTFELRPDARPEAAGAAVAQAVYRGITNGRQDTPGGEERRRAGSGPR